jgi:hypothetical protein
MKSIAICLLALAAISVNADDHKWPPPVQGLKEALCSDHPAPTAKLLNTLFNDADEPKLRRLMDGSDLTIALRAAWLISQYPAVGKLPSRPQRFLGFLEGRTGLHMPLSWEVGLASTRFEKDGLRTSQSVLQEYQPICPFLQKNESGALEYKEKVPCRTALGLLAPSGTSLARERDCIVISFEAWKVHLREALFRKFLAQPGAWICSAHLDQKRSVFVVYDELAYDFPIFCVDNLTGELLWQRKVWAYCEAGGRAGSYYNDVAVLSGRGVVAICGNFCGTCYLEAFDVMTGKPSYCFCTWGWSEGDS